MPYVAVRGTNLDGLLFNETYNLDNPDKGSLVILNVLDVGLLLEAHNNADHDAVISFPSWRSIVLFANLTVPVVRAKPLRVPARGTLPLPYIVRVRDFPLDESATN